MPYDPTQIYKKEWKGAHDFLGYERIKPELLPFEKAREIARSLGCKGKDEYTKLHKEKRLPGGMPHSPGQAYRDGWISWPDYLGYEPRVILPFEEARKIVRGLGCKGKNGYVKLYKERKLPVGIPHNPSRAYKNSGWITWADFLGKEPYWYKPLPFKEARQIARKLGCKNIDDYHRLYKQAKLPKGMPYNPDRAYCKKVIGR